MRAALALLLIAAPLQMIDSTGFSPRASEAFAKGGNNGGGNSGGGNSGGTGNGGGNGNSSGNSGSNGKAQSGPSPEAAPAPADDPSADTPETLDIRHRNGFREQVRGSRYVMRDAQGRTVVERRATRADRERLRRMTHR